MNAPAPGWNPDPTGRHEYRYWDGSGWTDDVSDNGVTSVDPVAGGPGADPTQAVDRTQAYAPQPTAQPGGYGTPGAPSGGYAAYGSSGQLPPATAKSGPSTGLLVGLAVVAIALIAGIVFVATSGGDDDDDTATGTTTTEGTDTTGGDDTTTTEADDGGDTDPIVTAMATGIVQSSDGAVTQEQAECAAQAMLDELGLETLIDIGSNGTDPFTDGSLTSEQQAAIVTAMTDCIPIDVLMDMGMSDDG